MVDMDTALRSAALDGRRSKGDGTRDRKESKRPGGDLGIEPFEPSDFHSMEKADTVSMWIVLLGSVLVALLMRYVMMPSMDGPANVLWLLPLLLAAGLPTLHRILLPASIHERYTFGNWFRASFLWVFTWLSVCILVVNPPLGDLSAPEPASTPSLALDADGIEAANWSDRVSWTGDGFSVQADGSSLDGHLWFVLGISDNADPSKARIAVRLVQGETILSENSSTIADSDSLRLNYDRLLAENRSAAPDAALTPHPLDVGVAIDLGHLSVGDYRIELDLEEQGDPWVNREPQRAYTLTIV